MKKQKTNKVKTVVYLIHFILIDIWARNGVLHIFRGGGEKKKREGGILPLPSVFEANANGIPLRMIAG